MRVSAESKKSEYLFIDTYRDVFKTYKLTESLHRTQTQVFHKKATMDLVRKLAGQTAGILKTLKVAVAEISK